MSIPARPKLHGLTSLLQDAGVVTEAQIQAGLIRQKETGKRIGETLVEMGCCTEPDIGWALARQLDIPFVDLGIDTLDPDLIRRFPHGMLRRLQAVPLLHTDRHLSVALADPTDSMAVQELERATRCTLNPSAATPSSIATALDAILGPESELDLRPAPLDAGGRYDLEWDRSGATFLLLHVARARREGASEIHFVPEEGSVSVFHRTPIGLVKVSTEPLDVQFSLLSRIEALDGPTIDDHVVHAAGQVLCPMGHSELRMDVSLLNCEGGVAVTLGLRPESAAVPTFETMGLEPLDLARVRDVLDRPAGLVIVTGSVRSGCSTTLTSFLQAASTVGRRSLAIDTQRGHVSPAATRLVLDPATARARWGEIAVGQNADVVALADVLPGEHIRQVLEGAASGRLLLVNTDWTDTFAMLDFLAQQPHHRSILARRLHLVIQQRRVPIDGPGVDRATASWQVVFEPLFIGDAMRRALAADDVTALRAVAHTDGFVSLEHRLDQLVASERLHPNEASRAGA